MEILCQTNNTPAKNCKSQIKYREKAPVVWKHWRGTAAATALGTKNLERQEMLFGLRLSPLGWDLSAASLHGESKVGAPGYQGSWDSRGQELKEKGNVEMQGGRSVCDLTSWHLPSRELCMGWGLETETPHRRPLLRRWKAKERLSSIGAERLEWGALGTPKLTETTEGSCPKPWFSRCGPFQTEHPQGQN